VREGCLPTNRLFYVDLAAVPKDAATGGLDFSKFDFEKGELCVFVCVYLRFRKSPCQKAHIKHNLLTLLVRQLHPCRLMIRRQRMPGSC
jgi:hypothetical protein